MISEDERRELHGIETRLATTDPHLETVLVSWLERRQNRTRLGYDIVATFSLLSATLCLLLSGVGAGPAGWTAAALAALTSAVRLRRFPVHRLGRLSVDSW